MHREEALMKRKAAIGRLITVMLGAAALSSNWTAAQQVRSRVDVDPDDIGGRVVSASGPESGVWVIAETTELPTRFTRIVVTDDQGRYLLPDLPRASYQLFVRGYGLLDSPRQSAKPGRQLEIRVTGAPDSRAAARIYPAAYWLSMLEAPAGDAGRQFSMNIKTCFDCHQLGNHATREISPSMRAGTSSTLDAWFRRTSVGPSGPAMVGSFKGFGEHASRFAEWTDRVAKGESPGAAPPRPAGIERNLVISMWDWGSPIDGRSDMMAADTRNPSINANGLVFGVAEMTDTLTVVDPAEHSASVIKVPSAAPAMQSGFNAAPNLSPHYGADVWRRSADVRSLAMDARGRTWMAVRNRTEQPSFCTSSSNKFAQTVPLQQSGRQVAVYDPKSQKWEHIDTCFTADHNILGTDDKLYFGQSGVIGWVDLKAWDRTHDAEASQGWCPAVIDTTQDGRITPGWTEPTEAVVAGRDHRINFGCYSIALNPKDGSLWCSGIGRGDKRLLRLETGSNPPLSCKAEFYEPPLGHTPEVFGSGGVEVDHNSVAWQNWRASGHLTSFDRSRCKSTKDTEATGQSCSEGWSVYRKDDPTYANSIYHANESYLQHLDAFDALGLGRDVPIYGSVNTDALEAFVPARKQFVTLRVPYPLGFFPRSANGRIDDSKRGWKGKGLWTSYSTYATWHIESGKGDGGDGVLPKAIKLQIRPSPLAK
jgi:hypothetical protein